MKHSKIAILIILTSVGLLAGLLSAANEVQLATSTEVDSAVSITTSYAAIDSLTFQNDDAKGEALLFISGEIYLLHNAVGYLAVSNSATGSAIILGNDTLFSNTERQYWNYPGFGNPDSRVPFSFTYPIDHDSTGVDLKLYLTAKKLDTNSLVKFYNIRMEAICDMQNDSI